MGQCMGYKLAIHHMADVADCPRLTSGGTTGTICGFCMTAVVFAGMGMSSVSIGFPRIPIMVIVGWCDFIAARRTSLRGGTVGRSAGSMGGGFGMALIPLTSAGMLLGVAGVFPFAPVMTQLFPVGTSTACADSCVRASGGAAGAVFCFRMAAVPLTGAGMGAVAIGSPHTPVMVQSRTGDLCEFSCSCRIRKILAADRAVPVFHITGCGTGGIYGIMLC